MMDAINPYLAVGILMIVACVYAYYLGWRDGYQRGDDIGFNRALDDERRDEWR
jgi:hypothetical protein